LNGITYARVVSRSSSWLASSASKTSAREGACATVHRDVLLPSWNLSPVLPTAAAATEFAEGKRKARTRPGLARSVRLFSSELAD